MPSVDINSLKQNQDSHDARRRDLLEHAIPFRKGVLEGVARFTIAASELGLRGIRKVELKTNSEALLMATFGLNGFDLVFVSTTEAARMNEREDILAVRMFIFEEGEEEKLPLLDINVQEADRGEPFYEVRYFDGERPGFLSMGETLTQESGRNDAAAAMINYFYDFKYQWRPAPSLGAILNQRGHKSTVGFYVSNR
ncbi:MAG: hypothetical protein KDE04_06360 [Anaerolineales bacterium]|nr:hypothetical protein [Anaerolineales bacterium]MCB8962514.1 hypothetical protein [Ardenticatenales bacterium]